MFRLGYNTNGLAHHRLTDALTLLAELGYEGVAITPDVGQLDLYDLDRAQVYEVRARASDLGLELAIETGARFLLDPRRKHFPTLLEPSAADRERRLDFVRRSLDLAAELGAGVVSIWSGSAPEGAREGELWERLVAGVRSALAHARNLGVQLAFEPEPGMFVERPAGYLELVERLGADSADGGELGLCLDVGHLLVTGDLPVGSQIRALAPRLVHVHLDDIRDGRHEHLMFGQGVLNLHETLNSLLESGYSGMAAVELSRDSHRGAWAAQESLVRIRAAIADLIQAAELALHSPRFAKWPDRGLGAGLLHERSTPGAQDRSMVNPPSGMHLCPTRVDGQPVLFAHAITPGMCQDRQRGLYHKCFTCVHNNAHGEGGMKAMAAFSKLPQPAKVSAG